MLEAMLSVLAVAGLFGAGFTLYAGLVYVAIRVQARLEGQ
jgi:hypothetical protein